MVTMTADITLSRFGQKVRGLRKERGWSQAELARLCGRDRSYVGGNERGESNISLVNIGKIVDAPRLDVRERFGFPEQ